MGFSTERGKIVIVRASWHQNIISSLCDAVKERLESDGYQHHEIFVPGSFELVQTTAHILKSLHSSSMKIEAIICVGILLKGETMHFEYLSNCISNGICKLSSESEVPIIYGVLNCTDLHQALQKSQLDKSRRNLGTTWAEAAIQQISNFKDILHL